MAGWAAVSGSETDERALGAKGGLADVLGKQGELPGARALYEAVLEAKEVQLGLNHPDTLNTKGNLGALFQTMAKAAEQNGERAEAAGLYNTAAGLWGPIVGETHELVVECSTTKPWPPGEFMAPRAKSFWPPDDE